MSKESALKFLNTLGTNEKAKALLEQRKPANEEEKIRAYAEIATELGEPMTAEDFREVFREMKEQIQKKTEDAAAGITALKDEDVEDVAGGFYYVESYDWNTGFVIIENKCVGDFTDTFCFWTDACNEVIYEYYACEGKYKGDIRAKLAEDHRRNQQQGCPIGPI